MRVFIDRSYFNLFFYFLILSLFLEPAPNAQVVQPQGGPSQPNQSGGGMYIFFI